MGDPLHQRGRADAASVLGALLCGAVALGLTAAPLRAQQDSGAVLPLPADTSAVVDRVVAVVGNRPILVSQVQEELFTRRGQAGLPQSKDSLDALHQDILHQMIDQELLVQEAQRDTSIKVTNEEVSDAVEQQVKKVRAGYPTELAMRDDLRRAGFQSIDEYRRWLADQQRREFYQNRLLQKLRETGKLKPVAPTEQEMRAYFARSQGQLGSRPATITFRQIIITPRATEAARAQARARADSIVAELRKGADFATAARRFSDDPGSKEQGGELGWFRRGKMVPAFERVAFTLKPGQISDPVATTYGFHIIQVERVQPTEVQARHILIAPEISEADVDSAKQTAQRVSAALEAGASFDSLQQRYHDPDEQKEAPETVIEQLPPQYKTPLAKADSGAVAGPFAVPGAGHEKYVIAKVTARHAEGEVQFQDVRDRIREQLGQQLAIQRYLDRLRRATYVEVRAL